MIAIFFLIVSAFASEEMKAGETLTEDSYVFSLKEAEDLKLRIIDLETKEKKLELYLELSESYERKIEIQNDSIEKYKEYSSNLNEINENNQLIIDKYMKKENLNELRMASYFVLGFCTAFGSVYLATQMD